MDKQRKCVRKQPDGSICGATEDLTKLQNLCKPCKRKASQECRDRIAALKPVKKEGRANGSTFWYKEAHDAQTAFKPFLKAWNDVTRRLS